MATNRVHIVIPKELTDEIDSLVGRRKRSSFVCEAMREKLRQHKQVKSIRKFAGSLQESAYPEWNEGSAAWVHKLRQEDQRLRDARVSPSHESSSHRHQPRNRRSKAKARTR